MSASLADLLFAETEVDDTEPAVVCDGHTTTRRELIAAADDVATQLQQAGVAPGSVVAVRLADGPYLIAALFGTWRAGCVYLPVNPRLTDTEIARLLHSTAAHAELAERGAPGLALQVHPTDQPPHDADVALIQMTSGTTGRPKAVLLRHSGVLALMDGVVRKLTGSSARTATRAPMPNLVPVSLSLWAGIYNVLFALRVGAPVVIMNGFETRKFQRLVAEHGIRSTVLPPAAMAMLTDDHAVTSLDPLRFVRSITAPLSPLQARRFHDKFGVSVLNSYGQTEIGGEIIGWNAQDSRQFGTTKLGAVGRPHDGVHVRVAGDEETGELQVRTSSMSAGYADGTDIADRLTSDEWFRTGDVGRIDEDGFVWIEGRVSDMINRGGLKVHPAEVEEVLRLADAVADVAVVGVPDERLGDVPVAFVVVHPGHEFDEAELVDHARSHLAPYKVPVRLVPVAELPRNEIGKVLTRELVDRASAS